MDAAHRMLLGAAILAFASACLFVLACGRAIAAHMAENRMQRSAGAGSRLERAARNGIPLFLPVARKLAGVPLWASWSGKAAHALRSRGYASSSEACGSIGICWIAVALAVGCLAGSPVAGMALAILGLASAGAAAGKATEMRIEAMREALPDALRMMGVCFRAGYSLQQTFQQVGGELSGPLGRLFSGASHRLETGASAREALDGFRRAEDVPELAFLSVALEVQHQAGGSMQHMLDAARESMEGELKLRRSLRVHTAQARLSARVVMGVTIVLVAVLSLLTEDFLAPFFASPLGFCLFASALAMQAAGIVAVRKLLHVEVG